LECLHISLKLILETLFLHNNNFLFIHMGMICIDFPLAECHAQL
jgi:hypothetical protein